VTSKLESTQLFKSLKRKEPKLAGRVVMVRDELAKWLPQIVQFFPQYPSHGLDHSDRIIAQLSKLLFDRTKPIVPFSPGEVYCLLCAAYLHDMGMVVSPSEVQTILASDTWKAFVAEGGKGHDAFGNYETLRTAQVQGTREQKDFFANLALRQVLADFVRRGHHERGKTTLEMHPFLKQLVDHGDSVAFETIADLGVGHGLSESDLTDPSRFPEERDVLGDKVNVRFLARLLRIGDLLDMDSRRADPMTAKAVAPLPPDAAPHWQQYSVMKHKNISPRAIEFTFECMDQETHRILRDWFGCLESEVRAAGLGQLHAARHDKWKVPHCIVSSRATPDNGDVKSGPTIIIKPANGANYAFHDWRLELDHERILERLIYDVYDNPVIFVRELIQNALDATRCQMYVDFAAQNPGIAMPERPTQFPTEFRDHYPVTVSLAEEEVKASPDTAPEKRLVFAIEDRGTGMNEQIITRYFLQVGRSYYQSNEFRERYKFAPASRFGVGFLSVFAVSKNITVETARRDDITGKVQGLRLHLREPRNYLLTEPWTPFADRASGPKHGTRIRVVLDGWDEEHPLVNLVRGWCVAVEVPVVVREVGQETVIRAERLVDKTLLATSKVDPNGSFILRTFDLNTHGVEGQIAVIAYNDEKGEGWCDCWPAHKGLDGEREDVLPKCGRGFMALHGLEQFYQGSFKYLPWRGIRPWYYTDSGVDIREHWVPRIDVRSAVQGITMARSPWIRRGAMIGRRHASSTVDNTLTSVGLQAVCDAAQRAVENHLAESTRAKGERGALYVGRVLSGAPVDNAWRDQYAGTVVTWRNGRREDISVAELLALEDIVYAAWANIPPHWRKEQAPPMRQHPKDVRSFLPIVSWSDTPSFSDDRFEEKIHNMNLCDVERHDDLWLFTFSDSKKGPGFERAHPNSPSWVAPVSFGGASGVNLSPSLGKHFVILDRDDKIIRWLFSLRVAAKAQQGVIDPASVEACWLTAADRPFKLSELIAKWAEDPRVPEGLKPPTDGRGSLLRLNVVDLHGRSTLRGK